jgi:hypothetical protein
VKHSTAINLVYPLSKDLRKKDKPDAGVSQKNDGLPAG